MNNFMFGMFVGGWEILLILLVLAVVVGGALGIVFLVVRWLRREPSEASAAVPPRLPPTAPETTGPCPRCGALLPANSPQGLCPRCVLGVGLATQTQAADGVGPHGTKVLKPPPAPADIARHFPQLEILECLGRGGMGVVYKARQPKLNRLVALKILAPEKEADPQFAERFLREAQALARLNHPNIVTVHDFGETDGLCYLLMEFVDGLTLRQMMREGRMKPEEALVIVPKICDALQFAHEQGIVHRDIKPENVLLDKQGRVKIADFGVAKIVARESGRADLPVSPNIGAAQQHGPTGVVGTPHYMAPEQVEHPQAVDHRADIYSLGVVFYEMLTGELPLGKFQPPSNKVQIDVRLDEVVLRALAKEPELRYQQASEVKTDLETIAGTPAPSSSRREEAQTESWRAEKLVKRVGIVVIGQQNGKRVIVWQGVIIALPTFLGCFLIGALVARIFLPIPMEYMLIIPALSAFLATVAVVLAGLKTPVERLTRLDDSPPGRKQCEEAPSSKSEIDQSLLTSAVMARWVTAARWTARILGTLCILLVVPFIIAEGLPSIARLGVGQQLTFAGGFLLLLGFIIGWWREGTAAVLIALGWTVVRVSESDFRIATPFELVLVVVALYALCWWAVHGRKTAVAMAAVATFAVLFVLGRLFCPTSVFVSGMITDAATGKPIADVRLGLSQKQFIRSDSTDIVHARTDKDGRFRLYVGWYAGSNQVVVSAPGYVTLVTNFAPRELGQHRINQDFQLWQYPVGPREIELSRLGPRSDCCLDFETGRVLAPPANLTQSYVVGNGSGATPGDVLQISLPP
jgi:tRNA A-37 threonylcarbamoyl transferase component Bud32